MSASRSSDLPSTETGTPFSKPMTSSAGSSRSRPREYVRVVGRPVPRVLHLAALDRAPPQVLVDRVDLLLRRLHRDAVTMRVRDALLAAHPPDARRGEDLEIRSESARPDLEADLVVSLAGATVRDRMSAVLPGRGHQMLHDHRPRQRRDERVLSFVAGIGADRGRARSSRPSRRARPPRATRRPLPRSPVCGEPRSRHPGRRRPRARSPLRPTPLRASEPRPTCRARRCKRAPLVLLVNAPPRSMIETFGIIGAL